MSDVKYWKDKLNQISQTSTKLREAFFDDDAIKNYYSDRGPTAAEKEKQANKFLASRQNVSTSLPSTNQTASTSLPPSNVTQDGTAALPKSNVTPGIGNLEKPKIKVLPGETMDQAMSRIKTNAPTLATQAEPNVWRDARSPQYAGLGKTQPKTYEPFDFLTRNPTSLPNQSIRQLAQRLGRAAGDEYTNVYFPADQSSGLASRGTTPAQDRAYISDLQSELQKNPNDPNLRGELERMQRFYPSAVKETSMSSAQKKSTGPKFPGYMRGTDPASSARSKMVGSVEESVQHRATVLMNRYKNFKAGK